MPSSERLRYAPLGPDDLRAFHGLIQDQHVRRYMLDGGVMTEDWSAARIRDSEALLLGVGHDSNTSLHLPELLAGVRYRRAAHSTVLRDGRPTRIDYGENDSCCARFALLDDWLEPPGEPARQRGGTVGHADARLARSRDIIAAATAHLAADETVFLHPPGADGECDEARASLPTARAPR